MKQKRSFLPAVFTLVMLACVLFVVWYVPAVHALRFQLQDVQKSLETSQGRERKQQYEYDKTVASLPEVQAELERIIPLSEAASLEVQTLKEKRKELRDEKKMLEEQSVSSGAQKED